MITIAGFIEFIGRVENIKPVERVEQM